jgi:hypothetical protein
MTRKKLGLTLFWIGVLYAFAFAVPIGAYVDETIRGFTVDELNRSLWAPEGLWFNVWGFGPPLGALVAAIGLLLRAGAGASRVWAFGIGVVLVVFIGILLTTLGHFPPLFGVGGALIVLSFTGTLWYWGRERVGLEGMAMEAADLRLVAYVFFFVAAWFTCGAASGPFMTAFSAVDPMSPIHLLVCFVVGWLFLFLSHYRSRVRA